MIARFLYENPRILFLTICVIVGAGVSSYWVMPRLEDPVLGKRVAVISTVFPGADSARVESLITIKIEERLRGIADIKQVRSNSQAGISNIVITLQDNVDDVAPVWSLVRSEIDSVESSLPDGAMAPEFEVFPLKAFAAIIAVKPRLENGNLVVVRRLASQLRTEITNISGVESVSVFGDPGEEFVVEVRPDAVSAMNLSVAAVASQIAATNVTQPAGVVRDDDEQLIVDINAAHQTEESLADVIVRYGTRGESCRLSEIADVRKTLAAPPATVALIDGHRSIVLGAFVDDSIRLDQWAPKLDAVLNDFRAKYQADIDVELIFSQSEYIEKRMNSLLNNLVMGAIGVTVVVFVLMGWRSMLIVGATLPLSALMVLAAMRAMELPIHQMSVTGLIVALGLLIDNAIVIVEDVRARIFQGQTPGDAIVSGVRHLAMPLFGSTLTTTLAFLPIATLPGPPGEFVGSIAISVILAIGSSFLLAMTVVPAMQGLMRFDSANHGLVNYGLTIRPLKRIYEWTLDVVFRVPILGVLLSIALPVSGFWVAQFLPEQFFPASDRNQVQVEVELPARETLASTQAVVELMDQAILERADIQRTHWFIGASAPTFYYNVVPRRRGTPSYAQAIIELAPGAQPLTATRELQTALDASFAECRVVVRQLEQGPPFDAPIELRVSGPDLAQLHQLGSQLRLLLSMTPNVIHTRSDFEESIPKLVVEAEPSELALAGLSDLDVAQQLYTTLEGANAGSVTIGEEQLPIRVRMAEGFNSRFEQVAALPLHAMRKPQQGPPNGGQPTEPVSPPLSAIAELKVDADQAAIVRINGKRTNEVKAYIRSGVLPSEVLAIFNQKLEDSEFELPNDYELAFGGEKEERSNAVNNLIANAVVLFLLMVLTLVASFRSFRYACIIAMVGGLALGLGPFALWLYGYPFGFMAIVGTMGLVGVAINDSIVVLAAIRENDLALKGDRVELRKVVVGATRHIIATTLTTIVGFVPLILGGGGFWPPLAISIAGGVGGATFLALYFVPAAMLLFRHSPYRAPSEDSDS